ncbi:MAG: hypothetical protein U1E05_13505, partial [Patescibacteria group bacterium]|nr:hypothetical protein [Patescibacteria group bacterium]
ATAPHQAAAPQQGAAPYQVAAPHQAAAPYQIGAPQAPAGAVLQGQPSQPGYPSNEIAPPAGYRHAPPVQSLQQPDRGAYPQGPGYVEPPRQESVPLPHRSSTTLRQPDRIASDTAELNAPFIRLTGATVINTHVKSE